MNCYIVQGFIIIIVFITLYFFQYYEKNEKKKNIYDKIKIPLFVSAIIGFILNINLLNNYDNNNIFIKSNENLIKSDINQEIYTDLANF